MTFERFVARRYLFAGKHRGSMSTVAFISVAGVALGVLALIVVTSVMDGFDRNLTEKFVGANAHITVTPPFANSTPLDAEAVIAKARAIRGVSGAAPVIQRLALLAIRADETRPARAAGVMLQGIDLDREPGVTRLMNDTLGTSRPALREIVVGRTIATQQLDAPLGQAMLTVAPSFTQTSTGGMPPMTNVTMAGTFQTGFPQTDEFAAYCSLETARTVFRLDDDRIDGVRVSVIDPKLVAGVAEKLRAALGPDTRVVTWYEQNKVLFDALRLEKWAMFVILLLVVLVAASNIVGTLTMIVLEKTREIGILKSMGASEGRILKVFLLQGLAIGGTGVVLGTVGALVLCHVMANYIKFGSTAAYMTDHIPVHVDPVMVTLIVLASLAIVIGASLVPARGAARLDPVEALRHD